MWTTKSLWACVSQHSAVKALSSDCGRKTRKFQALATLTYKFKPQPRGYCSLFYLLTLNLLHIPANKERESFGFSIYIYICIYCERRMILCGCVTTVKTMNRWHDGVKHYHHHHHRAHHLRSTFMLYINFDDNWEQLYASNATEQPCKHLGTIGQFIAWLWQ